MKENNIKKIAFVGTLCSGKTTLLDLYRKKHEGDKKVAVVRESARTFFEENPGIDRSSIETQSKIQDLVIKSEREAHESGAEIIFCDRSVLDAAVYQRAFSDKSGSEKLLQRVEFWIPTYHKILLLNPSDCIYSTDAIRNEDEKTRDHIHNNFIELFEEKHLPYEILRGNIDMRVKRIDEITTGDI